MPAVRTRQHGRNGAPCGTGIAFAENITPPEAFTRSLSPQRQSNPPKRQRKRRHHHSKGEDHVPRPPNAFILYRSWCIKGDYVPGSVEANHSTISQIIGRMWKALPKSERDIWYERAKVAHEEHRARYPQYTFRPTYPKRAVAEKRKMREVKPKDEVRCAKIVQLLVEGKKGEELNRAVEEFDRHHVPEVVMRFEAPLTETAYRRSTSQDSEDVMPIRRVRRKSRAMGVSVDDECQPKQETESISQSDQSSYPSELVSPSQCDDLSVFDFNGLVDVADYMCTDSAYEVATDEFTYTTIPVVMPEPRRLLSIDTSFLREWSSSTSPVSSIESPSPVTPSYTQALGALPSQQPSVYGSKPSPTTGGAISCVPPDACKPVPFETTLTLPFDDYTTATATTSYYPLESAPVMGVPVFQHEPTSPHGIECPIYMAMSM